MSRPADRTLAQEFCARSVHHLRGEFLPRLHRATTVLGADDLWWKPNEESTSAGNLLLHLEGNVRQWILSGIAGAPDERVRSEEFLAGGGPSSEQLLELLESTVGRACDVILALDDRALLERHNIQVFEGVTAMAAVLHVVEHFSWHTGQISWMAKLRTGQDLRYYEQPLE